MPRKSADARAAATLAAGKPQPPPASLSPAAAALWVEIVAARPAGYFDAGSLPLLRAYVACLVFLEAAVVGSTTHRRLLSSVVQLATKLRLTTQATTHRRAGLLDERSDRHPLLGGNVTTLRRPPDGAA